METATTSSLEPEPPPEPLAVPDLKSPSVSFREQPDTSRKTIESTIAFCLIDCLSFPLFICFHTSIHILKQDTVHFLAIECSN